MVSCEYAETDVPARYVQGRLGDDDAERFERHYFACDRCWAEIEGGAAVRAASRPDAAPRRMEWRAVPIAAALVLVFVGAWVVFQDDTPRPDALRDAGAAWGLSAERSGEAIAAQWSAIEGAASYRVRAHAPDGTPLEELEVEATSVRLRSGAFARHPRVYVTVEAIDEAGLVIDRSPPRAVGGER